MLSGLANNLNDNHKERIARENQEYDATTETIIVPTLRLETLLDNQDLHHIHYLTIDVECAEFDVIKSINFDNTYIDVIQFENNYYDESAPIIEYLKARDYSVLTEAQDIFMIHNQSMFCLNKYEK